MDCSITKNFLSEKDRMTKKCTIDCDDCPLCSVNNETGCECGHLEHEEQIRLVQKWSDEHPIKTLLSHLLFVFPETKFDPVGQVPNFCPSDIGLPTSDCDKFEKCLDCWMQPYEVNNE